MPPAKAKIPAKRLQDLAEAGLGLFCKLGYERCQVADVAKSMGVAVGTVYLYVESKEALFDLVLRYAGCEEITWLSTLKIPVKTPVPGTTMTFLGEALRAGAEWPVLTAALACESKGSAVAELREVLREQYSLISGNRRVLLLLMRCALEYPGLAAVFVTGLRDRLLERLAAYLEKRAQSGCLRQVPDAHATAAVMIQSIVWANLQRPQDPGMMMLSDAAMETATLDLLVQGMNPSC